MAQGGDGKRMAYAVWSFGVAFAIGFCALIWLLGPSLGHFTSTFIDRNDLDWYYYWQLPVRDVLGMAIVWAIYLANQISIWAVIYFAQKDIKGFRTTKIRGLPKYTYYALAIIVSFVVIHLIQTQLWFDGLAKDVPIMTSQGSVIVMLSVILVMENSRRGIFLGKKAGRPFTDSVAGFFRRTHMYIFAWALVYTFWFHSMAADPQLVSGFLYMFLLFTQLVLAWTPLHLHKGWVVFLEAYVAIHAVIVAIWNWDFFGGLVMWPMFFSGFAFMFVFTYMYAFKVPKWVWGAVTALYFGFLVWLYAPEPYGFGRGVQYAMRLEFLWIPMILYGLAGLFAVLAYAKYRK